MDRAPQDPEAEQQLHLVRLLPNFVSILALCSGLTAIRFAIAGNISLAVFLIALAAALDGLVDAEHGTHKPAADKPVILSFVTDDVDAWHAHRLLRRRNRHGRQHLSR